MPRTTLVPVALLLLALAGCASASEVTDEIAALTDQDVTFDVGWLGLQAQLSPRAQRMAAHPERARPQLLKALNDDRRFIAAHVLLTSFEKPLIGWWPTFNDLDFQVSRHLQQKAVLRHWGLDGRRDAGAGVSCVVMRGDPLLDLWGANGIDSRK